MKLARHKALDALAAEYLLGTLRDAARRRFERAMREEAFVATRVNYWQQQFAVRFSNASEVQPSPEVWRKITRDLQLEKLAQPNEQAWYAKLGLGWLANAWSFAGAVVVIGLLAWLVLPSILQPQFQNVARLTGDAQIVAGNTVVAALSKDGAKLSFKAERSLAAEAEKSFEVWLLPKEGGAPISLAVLASLDGQFDLPRAQVGSLASGAKLAVSVEPRGGSKTGAPTGPVILVGAIQS
jgi:anti-sigma-K factor RskA